MHATRTRPPVEVSADGVGAVSHVGARLLADLADRTTLTAQLSAIFAGRTAPQTAHDPGRVLVDLAVMLADGGECISDIATLADQGEVFGPVASDSTCWRVLDAITAADLDGIAAARAAAREVAWAQRAEVTRQALPASLVAGTPLLDHDGRPVLVIDEDATIVVAHSEKESAAETFKHSFGFHPVLAFCDNSNEALAGMLRAGNAGSNTAADLIAVLEAALAQIRMFRHGYPLLVRLDGAGGSKALLAHIRGLRDHGVHAEFSVGWAITEREHDAIAALPERAWSPAIEIAGDPRESAAVAELTGLLPATMFADYPPGMHVIVRRERPHPGAQLDLIEERDRRYSCFATDTAAGQHAWLDARHRSHARVEDRIRTGKDTGLGRFPSERFAINAAWLACALTAIDLIAWTQTILLHGQADLARAEPKTLRYRLLHVAARLLRGGPSGVWVANSGDGTIQHIDPNSGLAGKPIAVGSDPDGIAVDAHAVWVANGANGAVSRIDPATGADLGSTPVGAGRKGLTATAGSAWVANQASQNVTRIDSATGHVLATIPVGDGPDSIVPAGKYVWVSDEYDGTIAKIDPRINRVVSRFTVGV